MNDESALISTTEIDHVIKIWPFSSTTLCLSLSRLSFSSDASRLTLNGKKNVSPSPALYYPPRV